MEKDFTLESYKKLLKACDSSHCIITVKDYFTEYRFFSSWPFLILRHDVDRHPERALAMAKLEYGMGIKATYYFRVNPKCFKPEIIHKIAELGHEIGYHYEVMDKARGRFDHAQAIFENDLTTLRRYVPITTVSFHGNPWSIYRNQDFWQHFSPEQFELLGDANIDITDPNLYFTGDNGRGWNSPNNIKDPRDEGEFSRLGFKKDTEELIQVIRAWTYPKLYLLVHPNRWTSGGLSWDRQWAEDFVVNRIKSLRRRYESPFNQPTIHI